MSSTLPPIVARKGESVKLAVPLLRLRSVGSTNLPPVGTVGLVLAVQQGTHHLLVKWPGRSGPISVSPDEITKA